MSDKKKRTADEKKCPECGSAVEEGWAYCPACRHRLSEGAATEPTEEKATEEPSEQPTEPVVSECAVPAPDARPTEPIADGKAESPNTAEEKADEVAADDEKAPEEPTVPQSEPLPNMGCCGYDEHMSYTAYTAGAAGMPSTAPYTTGPYGAVPTPPAQPQPTISLDPAPKRSDRNWIIGLCVGCAACFAVGCLVGAAVKGSSGEQRLDEAEQKIENLEEKLEEFNPGHGIYNIEQLNEYLKEQGDAGSGSVAENLVEQYDKVENPDNSNKSNSNSSNSNSSNSNSSNSSNSNVGREGRGMMGVQIATDGDEVVVVEVDKDSPAEKAGIEEDDVIEKIDGYEVDSAEGVVELTSKKNPGEELTVTVKDKGDLKVTLE